ncbi:hypothetical protein [Microlunatus sp. Y2014]|uniref:hypothetical protein n=1 Tax=Microlunatus sp. Y2014 TaxID=3418488 RepID=UPI003DA74543
MLNRRTLLGSTAALGVAAGLAACSPGSGGSGEGGSGTGGAEGGAGGDSTPTYTAFEGVTPDLAGDAELGIPNGYYRFPDSPPKITEFPLPQTDPISVLTQGIVGNVPMDQSTWFKMLQTDLGNELPTTITASSQYTEKLQTLIAGGQLPDMLMLSTVPEMPRLLESTFTDLGQFIGGDKVSQYPGLASIPTTAWSVPTLNGKLWGIPQARPPAGIIMSTRGDLLEPKGIDPNQSPADGAEMLALMKEMNDPSAPQFAMGALPTSWLMNIILEMMDAPNGWAEEGGEFTAEWETEEYKEALVHVKEFWDAEVLHPNSFSDSGSSSTWWQGGLTQVYIQGFTNWLYFTQRRPEFNMGRIDIPKWDGGGLASKHQSVPGYGAYIAIPQQDSEERVHEILNVLNYLAAPYGTEEYLRANYGVPGEHYNMEEGVPVATDRIVDDPRILTYFGSQVLADLTGPKWLVDAQSEYLHEIMPDSKANATTGLYSATNMSDGSSFGRELTDVTGNFVQGRGDMKAFEDLIAEWQKGVGADIKAEYAEAKQQQG